MSNKNDQVFVYQLGQSGPQQKRGVLAGLVSVVALAGGLLTPSSGVRTALIRRLSASDWAHPVEPVVDPVLGALRLATGA